MKTQRILLLGNTGQVGWELNRTLLTIGEVVAIDYPNIDMSNPFSIRSVVNEIRPDLIVNATAYTDVDKAEENVEFAMAINGKGPEILAEEANKIGAGLIHYSTDYVFDGSNKTPYLEGDKPNPINVYGETKLYGEQAIETISDAYFIFRTSWVYSDRRPNFVSKVREWSKSNKELKIVDDQISSPTWARTLAEVTAQIVAQGLGQPLDYLSEKKGLYHLTSKGYCSRYEWAKQILRLDGSENTVTIKPAASHDFPSLAERPKFSVLSSKKIEESFFIALPLWQESLQLLNI